MNKKKLIMIGGAVLALIVIVIIIAILPKGNENNTGGTYLQSLVLATGEDKDKKPIGATEVFSVNDPEIHAIMTFAGLPLGTKVTYRWYDPKNKKILKEDARPELTGVFSGVSSNSLVKSDQVTWGVGNYQFIILLNAKIYATQDYTVKTDSDIQKDKILSGVKNIVLTTAVDLQGKPSKSISTLFSKDDENIFASITFQGIPVKTDLQAKWRYVVEDRLISTYNKTIVDSGTFAFGINAKRDSWVPIQKWPVGKYKLEIYLNSELYKEIEFSVQ